MKKIFILFVMLFSLCACASKPVNILYIEPADSLLDTATIDLVDDDNAAKLKALDISFNSQDITSLGYDLNNLNLKDSYGDDVDLSGICVIEAVATWCSYCANQLSSNNPEILERYPDVKLIEAFIYQEMPLDEYFKELGIAQNEDVTYLFQGEDTAKLQEELDIEYFPTFIVMKDGIVKLMFSGECDINLFERVIEYMGNPIEEVTINNSNFRTVQDVENDLGIEKIALLDKLEKSGNYATKDVTLKNIGRTIHIKDNDVIDRAVVFVSTYMFDDFIEDVNSYYKQNPDVTVYFALTDGDKNEKSQVEKLLDEGITIFDYLSVPDDIYYLEGEVLPTAFYIENNIVTGTVSAPQDVQTLIEANNIFFGDNSIARIN